MISRGIRNQKRYLIVFDQRGRIKQIKHGYFIKNTEYIDITIIVSTHTLKL